MERHAILELMGKLKLSGMRTVYDEIMTQAAKRHHGPERIVGDLLSAQLTDVQSRATAYRMGNAKFPPTKNLGAFEFSASPGNAALVRDLHAGNFLTDHRNVVLVGGTGSGKTHLAIAIGASCVRDREARALLQHGRPRQPARSRGAGRKGRPSGHPVVAHRLGDPRRAGLLAVSARGRADVVPSR